MLFDVMNPQDADTIIIILHEHKVIGTGNINWQHETNSDGHAGENFLYNTEYILVHLVVFFELNFHIY